MKVNNAYNLLVSKQNSRNVNTRTETVFTTIYIYPRVECNYRYDLKWKSL